MNKKLQFSNKCCSFKKMFALALFLCATMVFGQTELAENAGLETGDFTDWALFPNGTTQEVVTTNPSEGDYCAHIDNTQLATASVIKNANKGIGIVNPGDNITVKFDARGQGLAGGVLFAEFFSEISGGGTSKNEIFGGGPLALDPDPDTWKSFEFTTTAGSDVSGGVTLQFNGATGGAAGSMADYYIDNISIVDEDVTLSVEGFQSTTFEAYPNPTQNNWTVKTKNAEIMASIKVFNVLGKQVLALTPKASEVKIEGVNLRAGVYFARIKTDNGLRSVKLVKD